MDLVLRGLALVSAAIALSGCAGGSKSSGASAAPQPATIHTPQEFTVAGTFVETCTCNAPCGCEMIGLEMGCEGVGAMQFTSGSYHGVDLSGAKIVYAVEPGKWVRLYVDASPSQQATAEEFARAVYTSWGKIESVKKARVEIGGSAGAYSVMVDGGTVMTYRTEPVLGADHKTAVSHSNINDTLNTTVYQGKNVDTAFHDGNRKFKIGAGTNSFFNDHMSASGKI